MSSPAQELPGNANVSHHFFVNDASCFNPAEIRQAIAELVTQNQLPMARSLCQESLSLYPDSEDIVCISALLAEIDQDWPVAQKHLEKLIELQGPQSRATVWHQLIRVARSQLDPKKSLELAHQAIELRPTDSDLKAELNAFRKQPAERMLNPSTLLAH